MIAELAQALVAQENRANPYPIYERIREAGPGGVAKMPDSPVVFVSSYADCAAVLRSQAVSAGRSARTSGSGRASILAAAGDDLPSAMRGLPITMLDPPEHTRQRSLVSKAFTPRVIAGLRPAIMTAVDDFLDEAAAKAASGEPVDVVSGFALPLPFTVICQLLGFPPADIGKLTSWSDALLRSIDPMLAIMGNRQDAANAAKGIVELHRYVEAVVARRAAEPGPDLITALLAAENDGARADRDLVVRFCVVLLVSGYETLVNLITNGILALLRHPAQLAALRADPARAGLVVEEVLRYDPPVQLIVRTTTEPLELGSVVIDPSSTVVSVIAGAQREPGRYRRPDTFDPDRADQEHLAFGLGHHFCLGSALARLEGALALARFAQRVAGPRLSGQELVYRRGITIRGLRELTIQADDVLPRRTPWPAPAPTSQEGDDRAR